MRASTYSSSTIKAILFVTGLFSMITLSAQRQHPDKWVKGPSWLENAVMYQIYPSTYKDSDGNGIGDLPGIISELDYIQRTGFNVIWLSPVFESGWFDGGYDVIDFYKVDPRFGTNEDIVTLADECHERGIKLCLDLVAGHSSVKNEWFLQSGAAKKDKYIDYYIWADSLGSKDLKEIAQRNATPDPQQSKIGSWVEIDAPRGKYYLKNYYICQPSFNYGYANPDPKNPWEQSVDAPGPKAVRQELKNIISFWYDKGVDGFRVDMANSLVKNDEGKKETIRLWNDIRQWMDTNYPDHMLLSEWAVAQQSLPAGFNLDFYLAKINDLPYYGSLLWGDKSNKEHYRAGGYFIENDAEVLRETARGQKNRLAKFVENLQHDYNTVWELGYIALPSGNHDSGRQNRDGRNTPDQLKVFMTFVLTFPGVPVIYYGDEIGMRHREHLQSVEGSRPVRSGCRTPMQWTSGINAGFSTCNPAKLYLPVETEWTDSLGVPLKYVADGTIKSTPDYLNTHLYTYTASDRKSALKALRMVSGSNITVSEQESDPNSLLNFVKSLISFRSQTPALQADGLWEYVGNVNKPYPMVYKRTDPNSGASYLVILNPSSRTVSASIKADLGTNTKPSVLTGTATLHHCQTHGSRRHTEDTITLGPVSAAIFRL